MKKIAVLTGLSAMLLTSAAGIAADKGPHWGYDGHSGPGHWGDLADAYATCKKGNAQSPVNIETSAVSGGHSAPRSELLFSYNAPAKEVVNNGHTIQVNMHSGSNIAVSGKRYNLKQFHFHSPSEHTVNGKHFDMVAHLVHTDEKGNLAVIGLMFKEGKENKALKKIWAKLPGHSGGEHTISALHMNPADLLPTSTAHYQYSGSLTTPPCSEGVNWNVLTKPVEASAEQIAAFTKLFAKSIRPVQAVNGRNIELNGGGLIDG